MSNPFRYGALCPNCPPGAALLKARVDGPNSGPTLAPHLLPPYPNPSGLGLGQAIAGGIPSGYTTPYNPRMPPTRSTLHKILDFLVRNMIRSWAIGHGTLARNSNMQTPLWNQLQEHRPVAKLRWQTWRWGS